MSQTRADRQLKRRLAILEHAEEITGNVAMTCRYYGITRQSFYTWKRRCEELGEEGLRDRSKRPKVSPKATHVCVRPPETAYERRYQWSGGGWQAKLITFGGREWGRSRAEWQSWAKRVAVEITSLREGTSV